MALFVIKMYSPKNFYSPGIIVVYVVCIRKAQYYPKLILYSPAKTKFWGEEIGYCFTLQFMAKSCIFRIYTLCFITNMPKIFFFQFFSLILAQKRQIWPKFFSVFSVENKTEKPKIFKNRKNRKISFRWKLYVQVQKANLGHCGFCGLTSYKFFLPEFHPNSPIFTANFLT